MIARCEKQKRHGLTRFSKNGLKERQREKNEHEAVFSKKKKKKKKKKTDRAATVMQLVRRG